MNKKLRNKKIITLFIYIFFIAVNYLLYIYYGVPTMQISEDKSAKYDSQIQRIEDLLKNREKIVELQKEIDELNTKTKEFDTLIPKEIDTPQLIYDFYSFCAEYDIIGEKIVFEMDTHEEKTNNKEEIQKKSQEVLNEADMGTDVKHMNNIESKKGYITLKITLSVIGKKDNLIKGLYHVDKITKRRIWVNNISLKPMITNLTKDELNTDTEETEQYTDLMRGEIVFHQYIQNINNDIKDFNNEKQYVFFNKPKGFENISNLFSNQ